MITTNDTPTASTPLLQQVRSSYHNSKVYIERYRRGKRRHRLLVSLLVITSIISVTLVALLAWDASPLGYCYIKPLCRALRVRNEIQEIWWRNQGPYAPYKELDHTSLERLPKGCEVDQVTLVSSSSHRYG